MDLRPVFLLLLCASCAIPGSKSARFALSGIVESGAPPATVTVVFSELYGLGPLERPTGGPVAYTAELRGGAFEVELPRTAYHAAFCLIPPLGWIPRRPPPPAFLVTFADAPGERHIVGMAGDAFAWRVLDAWSREPKPDPRWEIVAGELVSVESGDEVVWHLRVRVVRRLSER